MPFSQDYDSNDTAPPPQKQAAPPPTLLTLPLEIRRLIFSQVDDSPLVVRNIISLPLLERHESSKHGRVAKTSRSDSHDEHLKHHQRKFENYIIHFHIYEGGTVEPSSSLRLH